MAISQEGHLIVTECWAKCITIINTNIGEVINRFGKQGSEQGEFFHMMYVHQNGNIFVTDIWNHRVQVLNPDLSYSHCFGSKGDKPGELNEPRGI